MNSAESASRQPSAEGEAVGAPGVGVSMRERIAAFDWSRTPLGPRKDWPPELSVVVQQIIDSHFPKAVVWGPEGTTIYNDAFVPILGRKPDALGQSFRAIWSEAWDELGPIAQRAYAGDATYVENFPLTVERGGAPEEAWFTFCYSPLRRADGTVVGMLDTVIETTQAVRAREEALLLSRELGHRLKNTLTLVQAIAGQSLREFSGTDAVQAFRDRLNALGYAHDLLLREDWNGSSIREAAVESLRAHDAPGRLRIDGPDIQINSRATVTLAMILNELATNAVKYGSLSTDLGAVDLTWQIEGERLRIEWSESGGPPVVPPGQSGLGTRLVDRGFGGSTRVDRDYRPDGLRVILDVAMDVLIA